MLPNACRLRFALLYVACGVLGGTAPGVVDEAAGADSVALLKRDSTGAIDVRVELRLGGDLAPPAQNGATASLSTPVALRGLLEYRQQPLEDEKTPNESLSLREYTNAKMTQPGKTATEALRSDRRLVIAEMGESGPNARAVNGPLLRSELDLLQLAADPLMIDRLLPQATLEEGATWNIPAADAAALLLISDATISDISAVLSDVTPTHARFRFAGAVHGLADGAMTESNVRGVALFDRRLGRISRLNLAVQERRQAGPATPALDAGMKINVSISPAEGAKIAEAKIRQALETEPEDRLLVEEADSAWSVLADRDWYVVSNHPGAVRLRLVRGADVAAFATLSTMPHAARGKLPSVSELESDVRYSLGKRMTRLLATDEWITPAGMRCVALGAEGRDEQGVPTEWRHYHAALQRLAVALAVTLPIIEGEPVMPVGRRLIDTLRIEAAGAATNARRTHPLQR